MNIKTGRYRHYKGRDYQVLALVQHSETEEIMVLYRPLYGSPESRSLWVRPLAMFNERVVSEGQQVARFEFVESMPEGPV